MVLIQFNQIAYINFGYIKMSTQKADFKFEISGKIVKRSLFVIFLKVIHASLDLEVDLE